MLFLIHLLQYIMYSWRSWYKKVPILTVNRPTYQFVSVSSRPDLFIQNESIIAVEKR
jgi:hypothetical protein